MMKKYPFLILSLGLLMYVNNNILPKSLYLFLLAGAILVIRLFEYKIFIHYKGNGIFILFLIFLLFSSVINGSGDTKSYIIYYTIGMIYMCYFSIHKGDIAIIKRFYYLGSLCFSVITIFSTALEGPYTWLMIILYGGSPTFNNVMNLYSWGEYSGIAGQTGYNAFAIAIGLLITFSSVMEDLNENKKIKPKKVFLGGIQLIALFLCSKRSVILFMFLTVLILILHFIDLHKIRVRVASRVLTGTIVITVLATLLFSIYEPLGNFISKNSFYLARGDILNGRSELYKQAIGFFMDHPLIGIGAKNFYKHNALGLDVHNVYLQLLAENGVIGFCLMIFAFAYRLRIAYYCSKANFDADLVLCLGVQIFFLLYSLTGNALYDVNFFYVYLIFSSYTLGTINAKQNE